MGQATFWSISGWHLIIIFEDTCLHMILWYDNPSQVVARLVIVISDLNENIHESKTWMHKQPCSSHLDFHLVHCLTLWMTQDIFNVKIYSLWNSYHTPIKFYLLSRPAPWLCLGYSICDAWQCLQIQFFHCIMEDGELAAKHWKYLVTQGFLWKDWCLTDDGP